MLRYVSYDYHLICVDMPGHGGTTFLKNHDRPTIQSFAESLREFFEVTNLDKSKVNLVGCSFGGNFSEINVCLNLFYFK